MSKAERSGAKIVSISSNKGGVLKTSIAVNIAGIISQNNKKVLLIDLDNQGNVATSFGINPDNIEITIYDLLTKNTDNPNDAVQHLYPNLDMIAANDDMAYIEIDILTHLSDYPNYFDLLKDSIKPFLNKYDYIIMDTPPSMGLIAANIFNASQDIVIPYHPEPYSFRSLVKTITAINNFKSKNDSLTINEIIPVRVRPTVLHSAFIQSARGYAEANHIKMSENEIANTVKYAEMIAQYNAPLTLIPVLPKKLQPYKDIYVKIAKELGYIG